MLHDFGRASVPASRLPIWLGRSLALPKRWLLLALIVGPAARAVDPQPRSTSTVGMPAKIEQLVLPGTELEAKPIEDRRAPVVVRIVNAYPHGSPFRYDIFYYG